MALSVTTQYDDTSAVIGSNKVYAAIHQLGGQAGKNKKTIIPARPYLSLFENDYHDILEVIEKYF